MGLDWISSLGAAVPQPGYVALVFLLTLRLGALLLLTPILYAAGMPPTVRVLLVVGLAAALALGLPESAAPSAQLLTSVGLLEAAVAELALGATLALGIFIAFAAISMAGRLIDVQIGFGMAQVFDPATQRQIPILTAAFNQLGVLVFFLVNGHHALLRGVAYTLERYPPGRPWPVESAAPMVAKQMASLFSLGFALAAPVVVCLLLVELAMGVVARNLPQMNMFVIGIPVKIVVGLVLLSVWFAGLGDAMSRTYGFIFRSWETAFAASGTR
ncbi:MAG TPA: flagellar biosynthetic protein FliR [Ramlibacter sp.]|nr:flagellar biosynthetic protein FliR [Ramlibacter sp.]